MRDKVNGGAVADKRGEWLDLRSFGWGQQARPKQQPWVHDEVRAERAVADYKERILQFISTNGPSLPNETRKEIGRDTIITSAMLSELSSRNLIKMSHLKVGGSPLYYIEGQEPELLRFVDYLHNRERDTLKFLWQESVVRDADLTPVQRVAMRELKDFASPITASFRGRKEMFWKWYLAKNEDVSAKVKHLMLESESTSSNLQLTSGGVLHG